MSAYSSADTPASYADQPASPTSSDACRVNATFGTALIALAIEPVAGQRRTGAPAQVPSGIVVDVN